jgi:hypothetical protein
MLNSCLLVEGASTRTAVGRKGERDDGDLQEPAADQLARNSARLAPDALDPDGHCLPTKEWYAEGSRHR